MKVRCIDNSSYRGKLTEGKVYEVLDEFLNYYKIKNDNGSELSYFKSRFEIVKENEEMKELTLQEVMNYEDGKFKMGFEDWEEKQYIEIELSNGELWYDNQNTLADMYRLKDILEAKYYLIDDWQEIDYYAAYTTTNSNIKFVSDDEEIVGTHYYILSKLNSDCMKNSKNLNEVLANGKWFIKVV